MKQTIEEEATGTIHVTVNSQYNNINATDVTVEANVLARLFGCVKNKLVIKEGACVHLHGSISGEVENNGGELHVYHR